MMKRFLAILMCFILAVFLFVGCTSTNQSEELNQQTTAQTVKSNTKNDLIKKNSDALNIGINTKEFTKNPYDVTDMPSVNVLNLVYDSLFYISTTGDITNGLCEKYEYTSDNEVVLTLRNETLFHNGKQLTANDVKYTIDLIKSKSNSNAVSTIYIDAYNNIVSATVVDNLNIKIQFNKKGISPLYSMRFPILPSDGSLTGTGLYKMDTANNDLYELSYFENAWRTKPNIEKVSVVRYNTEDDMARAYKENAIDIVFSNYSNIGLYKYSKNTNTSNARTNTYYYLMANMVSGKLSNSKLRKILCYTFKKEDIISRAFDSNALVSDFPIPSSYFIYDNELLHYSTDIGKATQKFEEIGYVKQDGKLMNNGNQLSLKVIGVKSEENIYHSNIATTLKTTLGEFGINVEINLMSVSDYSNALKNKNYDIAIASCTIPYNMDLDVIIGSGGSLFGLNNSNINTALNNINNESKDMNVIKEQFVVVQEELIKTMGMIGLCYTTDTLVYNDRISGEFSVYSNYEMLNNIYTWTFE